MDVCLPTTVTETYVWRSIYPLLSKHAPKTEHFNLCEITKKKKEERKEGKKENIYITKHLFYTENLINTTVCFLVMRTHTHNIDKNTS